ncbi:hypothetical protein [Floridanema aerugineum]|uniref:Uncharacterized protein n=1 Tax=Floridaenema aerugineum BLCC-F46 TaxID=3153654 RepID=A0ABV4X262_9CYAN
MAQNTVTVNLVANNFVTGAIQNIKNSIGSLSGTANSFAANFMANLSMVGLNLAINKVRELGSTIVETSKLQTTMLATASDVGTNLGVGFDKAKNVVAQTNDEIAKMAAALPGTTAGYNAVFNSLAGTLAKQFRGDTEQFSQVAMDITKRVGVLASIRNVDPGQSGAVIERLINGSSGFAELAQNDILQKNAVFKQALIDQMTALGIDQKQWKQLSNDVRLGIVRKALTVATPDTLIDAFNGTVDSTIESIKSNLFDPMIGVFGFLRKVPSAEGRTVIDAVQGFLQAWLGFSESMGKLASRLGFNFDPLEPLIGVIDFLADIGNTAHLLITDSPQKVFKNLSGNVEDWVKNFSNNFTDAIASLPKVDPVAIGYFFAQVVNQVNDLFNSVLNNTDWSALGFAVGDFIGKAVVAFGAFLVSRDWSDIGQQFLAVVLAAIKLIGGLILGALNGLLSAVRTNLYDAAIRPLQDIENLVNQTWQGIIRFFKGLYDKVTSWLTDIVNQLKPQNVLSNLGATVIPQPIQQAVSSATQGVGGIGQAVIDAVTAPIKGLGNLGQGLLNRVTGQQNKPTTDQNRPNNNQVRPTVNQRNVTNNNQTTTTVDQRRVSNTVNQVRPVSNPRVQVNLPNILASVPRQLTGISSITPLTTSRTNPTAQNRVNQSLVNPVAALPIRQPQVQNSTARTQQVNHFNPQVNVEMTGTDANPDAVAQAVMDRITVGYRSFLRQQIA